MTEGPRSILKIAKAGSFGLKLPTLPANPFVGLRPFNSDEALLYFGRREQTIELLQQLHRTHFVAMVGSSGCGKSSLVRAGLIPKLQAGFLIEEREQWRVATMKPGDAPLRHLAEALSFSAEALREGDLNALRDHLTPALEQTNLLLLIDQFEELFRFGLESNQPENRAEATRFVEIMLALSRQRDLPVYVVMTMRSDFIGDCDNFHGLPEAMNQSQYLVPRLTREQLRQAIEGPIHLFGGSIPSQLLERLLDDAGEKSDQLPVLQHALMRTWEKKGDAEIDLPHYVETGTITEALSNDADLALKGLTEEEQLAAKRMFQALTETDAGNRRIRRPAHLNDLLAITEASPETIQKIIDRFTSDGRSFLTLSGKENPLIDISHESLIRQWKLLGEWIKEESTSSEIYLRLSNAAKRREQLGSDLYRGPDLQEALDWREKFQPNNSWAQRYAPEYARAMQFLDESEEDRETKRSESEAQEREVRRRRELHRARIFGSIVTFLLGVAILLALYAQYQQRKAEEYGQQSQLYLYAASMNLANSEFEKSNSSLGYELLNSFLPTPESPSLLGDVRNYFWYHLWRKNHNESNTLKGHDGPVWTVAVSPDGKSLASAGIDKTIRVWDVKSTQPLVTLKGHENIVTSVAFAPDGKTLASASLDKTVRLWDTHTAQLLAIFRGHEEGINSVSFAPDGKTLASASIDKTIKLWDIESSTVRTTLWGHQSAILSVAFAPNGRTLASASNDKVIRLWDPKSFQTIATLKSHTSAISSVAFAPDSETLASASYDSTIKLWNVESAKLISTLSGLDSYVKCVAFAPDGKTLASAGFDKTIKIWNVESTSPVATLNGHGDVVTAVTYSPDGKHLTSASYDSTIKLWATRSVQPQSIIKGLELPVTALSFAPDGKTLASASSDNTIKLWDVESEQLLRILKAHLYIVNSIAFAPDGKTLASASYDKTIKLWDVRSGRLLATLNGHDSAVNAITFAPDGKTLASASNDKTIRLWNAQSHELLTTFEGHEDWVTCVTFSPDGKKLASSSYDHTIRLWDVRSTKLLTSLNAHDSAVRTLAFSPDGKMLGSGSDGSTIRLWDVRSAHLLATLKGHEYTITSVIFAPDGKTLASASSDKTIKLWDPRSTQLLATLSGHKETVTAVTFSPDGKIIASASLDKTIRLWRAATDEEVSRQR